MGLYDVATSGDRLLGGQDAPSVACVPWCKFNVHHCRNGLHAQLEAMEKSRSWPRAWESLRGCKASLGTWTFPLLLQSREDDGQVQVLATCLGVRKGLQGFLGDLDFSFLASSSSKQGGWKSPGPGHVSGSP